MHEKKGRLDLNKSDWSIGEQAFQALVDQLNEGNPPGVIVEFGSGRSTVRLAEAFPDSHIFSIEHDPQYFEETRGFIDEYNVSERVTLFLRPLTWRRINGLLYRSYALGPFPEVIDAVVIDGPPSWSSERGRGACMHDVYTHLGLKAKVCLDDFHRLNEQQIVNSWLSTYPGSFDMKILDVGHQICVLTKRENVIPAASRWSMADHYAASARLAARMMRHKIKAYWSGKDSSKP